MLCLVLHSLVWNDINGCNVARQICLIKHFNGLTC
jgi:hypothetical protein